MAGESKTETFDVRFASLPPGPLKLAIGLFLDPHDDEPAYRLAIQGRTPHGWYVLLDKLP